MAVNGRTRREVGVVLDAHGRGQVFDLADEGGDEEEGDGEEG